MYDLILYIFSGYGSAKVTKLINIWQSYSLI